MLISVIAGIIEASTIKIIIRYKLLFYYNIIYTYIPLELVIYHTDTKL